MWAAAADAERQAGNLSGAFTRLGEARTIIEKAATTNDDDSLAYFQSAGRLRLALGDAHAAREAFERAVAIADLMYDEKHPTFVAAEKELAALAGAAHN